MECWKCGYCGIARDGIKIHGVDGYICYGCYFKNWWKIPETESLYQKRQKKRERLFSPENKVNRFEIMDLDDE